MTKTYFSYKPPKKETGIFAEGCHRVLFLGNKKEIRKTLEWYQIRRGKVIIPTHRELIKLNKIDIICHSLPYITEDTNYLTTIYKNPFRFIIFPDMLKTIEINSSSRWKRGELYKIITEIKENEKENEKKITGVYFIPKEAIKLLTDYNWEKRRRELSDYLILREKELVQMKEALHK